MSNEHIENPDGTVLVTEVTAAAILAAADQAGVPADAVLYSPIRVGYVVPVAVADALTSGTESPKRGRRAAATATPAEEPVEDTPAAAPATPTAE